MKQKAFTTILLIIFVFIFQNNVLGQYEYVYRISSNKIDTTALNSYPQKIIKKITTKDTFDIIVRVTSPMKDSIRFNSRLSKLKTKSIIEKLGTYSYDIKKFTEPTKFVQTENKIVTNAVDSLITNNEYLIDFIEASLKWTNSKLGYDTYLAKQISLGLTYGKTVNEILATNKGTCGEYTTLFCSVMRKAGIPTRYIVGLASKEPNFSRFGQHSWAEYYIENLGWIHVDPSVGKNWSPAYYVKLWENIDFKSMDIKLNELKTKVSLIEE